MRKIGTIFLVLFISFISTPAGSIELPQGFEKARWGMSVEEVSKVVDILNLIPLGKPYADHFEWKPDVYVSYLPPDWRKVEYYFYNNKLYKIFIMHSLKKSKFKNPLKYYESLVNEATKRYGKPQASYEDATFGFPIWHNVWDDNITQLDFRMGSRFIHKVLMYKKLADAKGFELEQKSQPKGKNKEL